MHFRVCSLASGSDGNCTYAATAQTAILVDAGLSAKETVRRLTAIGVDIASIQGICVTHEHADHTTGLDVLHRRHGIALYANSGTIEGMNARPGGPKLNFNVFSTGAPFRIGDLDLEPFSVPHDAYDPVGFVIRSGEVKAGIVTDMGMVTTLIRERLRDCRLLVIEANHDEQMLKDADRPWSLKQRIFGRQGHLSNAHAAELIADVAGPGLREVFLAHLSADCNRPELALAAVRAALVQRGAGHVSVKLAPRDQASDVWVSG